MKMLKLIEPKKFVEEEKEIPDLKKGEVLIKIKKVGVCGSDIATYFGKSASMKPPIVLGHEFSGVVEKLGDNVKEVKPGAEVTILPHISCGSCDACKSERLNLCPTYKIIGCDIEGAYSDYIIVPSNIIFELPNSVTLEQGAMVEPASVAIHGVKLGIQKGDNVLIFGAGPIGVFALQSAFVLGASKVVIADIKEDRLNIAKSLSNCEIINLSTDSIESGLEKSIGEAKLVDLFIDCVGSDGTALDTIIKIAKKGARIIGIGVLQSGFNVPHLPDITQHGLTLFGSSGFFHQDFRDVINLMVQGKIVTDNMITHRYNFEEIPKLYNMIEENKENFFKIIINL